jgi:maltose-binding protein MalE
MRLVNRTLVLATSVVAVGILLTACSSDSSGSSSASPTSSETAGESGSTGVVSPIEVKEAADVSAKVGNAINVTTTNAIAVQTDNPSVLELSQPGRDGSATFNAGAVVVGEGAATLTVFGRSGVLYVVNVTAAGQVPSMSPGTVG